jgi:hypothetical protein
MMDFKEDLLQMVWKYQYFEKRQLTTTDGLSLEVKKIGYHNFYEGPDFLEALIKIGNLEHFGHVEVHRKSSDWKNHAHDSDQRYDAVILHVVWEDDKPILRNDGSHIPTLELKGKIWLDVLRNYERLVSSKDEILCGSELKDFLPIIKFSMLEKALVERLEKKSTQLIRILEEIKNDWEEGTYRWLFQCFGFKTNSEAMLRLAESIPYRTLQKHGKQSVVIEAILLGQADLIPEDTDDEYGKHLKKEYDFYQKKYSLKKTIHHQEWKMMGVRPHNFPAVRIAQLAQILSNNPNLFSSVNDASAFKKVFEIQVPDYWQQHFRIGGLSQKRLSKKLSHNTLALLTINFTVPLWYTYGQYLQDSEWKEKCFDVLQDLAAEDNFIIRKFSFHSWKAQNAFDSQGMLGLYHDYCKPKKCLECKIGQNLLKPGRN